MQNHEELAATMVERQLVPRGIKSEAVLNAMRSVARHLFVPADLQAQAYNDSPLPIGLGQTISQPYIVAYMTEQLQPKAGMKILEIGTGSGYQAAILAFLGSRVYTIEFIKELAVEAKSIFSYLNLDNIEVKHGNGYLGWQEEAPFDAIIVTAAPKEIPLDLLKQLKDGGKMIVPVGPRNSVQSLKLITKNQEKHIERDLILVRFVPMVES